MHELNWGLPVILYLFLGGMGAGAGAVSASIFLRSGGGDLAGSNFRFARWGALLAPVLVILGTGMIVLELGSFQTGHYFRFINLFRTINLSPMSIGSWVLALFILVSLAYAYTFLRPDAAPGDALQTLRKKLAWAMVPLGLAVALYTGVLLGAMPARPFWNSPILAMLFMVSALSTGVAAILLVRALFAHRGIISPENFERHSYMLSSSDMLLIGLEVVVIFLFLMFGHLTVGNVKTAMSVILGGEMSALFWFGFVLLGLVLPGLIEMKYVLPTLLYQRPFAIPRRMEVAICVLVLVGGFMLRYVVVIAGQMTGPVGI
ncbi:polysulfide reductase NrfD [Aromatoleum toluclasticum]|uniref:NrfD/PsrC family molybdoenzyme membrane anchor subunit n=1 Tax=Aromatoleum toluclasticum TaxID=92003 RepID=UPI001D18C8A8|nr:NrfD/PsrC family molybdoenzyme membrane anchor subunit [Aromatoleum toluclasticum]MCC4114467.1 polysulfide reductase NrfD [Aromatoleum toluclasticum]